MKIYIIVEDEPIPGDTVTLVGIFVMSTADLAYARHLVKRHPTFRIITVEFGLTVKSIQ